MRSSPQRSRKHARSAWRKSSESRARASERRLEQHQVEDPEQAAPSGDPEYTLAADRGNPALERYRYSLHPALLQLIRLAVEAAERGRVELSICGEMAGDPEAALLLAGLGVRVLSMSPTSIAAVRRALRAAVKSDLERIAMASLADSSPDDVRRRLRGG